MGADYRAFQRLYLSGYNLVFIEWIASLKDESLSDYAKRLLPQIKDERPVLIGLSFGGMVALELSKLIKPAALILISSARNKDDLHTSFPWLMKFNVLKLLPEFLLKRSNFILEYLMGINRNEDRKILAEIIADTNASFLIWALSAMSKWENQALPEHLIEIHGTADRLIPFRRTKYMKAIEGGGHLMILNKAGTIQKIILDYLYHLK
ncbi:alpha/beta hydrolase [Taibaiella lutea]|uniref:alpha/beta hydrolase n=1 Tax=Taibaiella lutea TaxID=2608001 RepID=UPI00167FE181|nr:alpha/beta hydrolase [Taibaiella lutea]